jgi:hypothetical protein
MARSNYKSDYKEAIGFVTIRKSCVAFYRSKRKTIIVGDRDILIKISFYLSRYDNKKRSDFVCQRSNS